MEEPHPSDLTQAPSVPAEVPEALRSDIPHYHVHRPEWAAEITSLFPQTGATPDGMELSFQFEYQPRFLQSFGILGIGPSLDYNAPFVDQFIGINSNYAGTASAGAQIRYQARFFREQILVPMVGYSIQYCSYAFTNAAGASQTGNVVLQGSFFGAMILLNDFEPSAAASMYVDNGVLRTYLVGEIRNLAGTDGIVNFTGPNYYLGLRFEF